MRMKIDKCMLKLATISIKRKPRRTCLSLLAISLCTMVIFTSLVLFKNIYAFSKTNFNQEFGNFHYAFVDDQKISDFKGYHVLLDQNTNYYATLQNTKLNLRSIVNTSYTKQPLPFKLVDGRFPINEKELVVIDTLGYQVGDTISLDFTQYQSIREDNLYPFELIRNNLHSQTFDFTIVGIYTSNDFFNQQITSFTPCYTLLPTIGETIYYVYDDEIHNNLALDIFAKALSLDKEDIITNQKAMINDTVQNYLRNPSALLLLIFSMTLLSAPVAIFTIRNALLISDEKRKKEIGLLKSTGASPSQILHLIQYEMLFLAIVGSLIGIILGMMASALTLQLFVHRLYVTYDARMVINFPIIVISLFLNVCLTFFSGVHLYRNMIETSPYHDLYVSTNNLPIYDKIDSVKKTSAWQLFLIYHQRTHKESYNLRFAFTFLLLSTTLFSGIFLHNMVLKNKNEQRPSDFIVSNSSEAHQDYYSEKLFMNYPDFDIELTAYELVYNHQDIFESITIERYVDYSHELSFDFPYDRDTGAIGITILDATQMQALKKYVVQGSIDNLQQDDIILLCNADDVSQDKVDTYINMPLTASYKIDNNGIKEDVTQKFNISACARFHFNDFVNKRFPNRLGGYKYVIALDLNNMSSYEFRENLTDYIYININNALNMSDVQLILQDFLSEKDLEHIYVLENLLIDSQTNHFTAFMMEVIFYPLLLILIIVSIANVYHTLLSYISSKRIDIAIMRFVGMGPKQLKSMLLYEYIEQYIQSLKWGIMTIIPIYLGLLMVGASPDLIMHFMSGAIVAFLVFDVIIVYIMVIRSSKHILKSQAVELFNE